MDNLLTTDEVAERLRTSPSTVRYWRMTNYGPVGVKVGRRVLYAEAEVEAWLQEQRDAIREQVKQIRRLEQRADYLDVDKLNHRLAELTRTVHTLAAEARKES